MAVAYLVFGVMKEQATLHGRPDRINGAADTPHMPPIDFAFKLVSVNGGSVPLVLCRALVVSTILARDLCSLVALHHG
jgi:hypothetical protein